MELEYESTSNIIKVKMRINPTLSTSVTYNINMSMFGYEQPEEFLALLKNFRIKIDVTDTTSPLGQVNYLHKMLGGDNLI